MFWEIIWGLDKCNLTGCAVCNSKGVSGVVYLPTSQGGDYGQRAAGNTKKKSLLCVELGIARSCYLSTQSVES